VRSEIIKKTIFYLIMVLAISSVILVKPLSNLDEIWNYNFARNILEGRIPYKDFNMVTTPVLPFIAAIFLKIFGNELIVMRFLAIALSSLILGMIFKIFSKLKINKYIAFIVVIGFYFLLKDFFCFDYNFANILIILIIICLDLKQLNENNDILYYDLKTDFIIGFLSGLCICFKQTTGLVIAIITIFYKVLLITNFIDFKIFIKIMFKRFLGMIIPVTMLFVYLLINNALYDFIDYCIKGVKTFDNYILYTNLLKQNLITRIFSILVPLNFIILFIITVVIKQKNNWQKQLFIIFAYSLATFVVAFPISDKIHFFIGSIPCIVSIIYIIYLSINKLLAKIKFKNKLEKIYNIVKKVILISASFILIAIIMFKSTSKLINYFTDINQNNEVNHFKYVYVPDWLCSRIENLGKYILKHEQAGKKVYVLYASAAIYTIPLDKYNKDYDMFLKGNLGGKSEEGLIEKIKKEENAIYLVLNDSYKGNWQTPENVVVYVKNNLTKIDSIEIFDIYK